MEPVGAKSAAGVDFRGLRPEKCLPKTIARGGGEATDCAGVGFGAIRATGFQPSRAGAYFRGRGACTQYDPKVMLGAKNPRP